MPNVRFLGELAPEEMPRYYRHAVAVLVPSEGYEAFPRVLIEALSSGTPVVARGIGPVPEFVAISGAGEIFSTPDQLAVLLGSAGQGSGASSPAGRQHHQGGPGALGRIGRGTEVSHAGDRGRRTQDPNGGLLMTRRCEPS